MGGNSITLISLASKIHKILNVRIPLREVFDNPNIHELSAYIKRKGKEGFLSIEPVEKKEYYSLSSAQKRMYIAQHMDVEGKSYNMPMTVVLKGELDLRKLNNNFKHLIKRHEGLRTSFILLKDGPVQRIHEDVKFEIEYYNPDNRKQVIDNPTSIKVDNIVLSFIRPFDLTQAPLLRVGLIKMEKMKHILMVDMYHIISDGISFRKLLKEFITLYNGKMLPELLLHYKDFSQWQNRLYKIGEIKKQEQYWLNEFTGDIPTLDLATDYPRPAVREISKGDFIRFTLERELSTHLHDIVKKTNTTIFMVLLAVYNVLLFKYTKEEDIVVGSPVTGRSHEDLQNIIGVFLNMLAMRNRPTGHKTFRTFLEEVKTNALNAYENQDYHFDELVIKLGLQGDVSRNPLFDTEFAANKNEPHQGNIHGLKLEPYSHELKFAKFDLHFLATEIGDTLKITLRYSTALFKRTTIERMKTHFIEILQQVVEEINIKLENISLSHKFQVTKPKLFVESEESFEF